MSRPQDALVDLAERLRAEGSVVSGYVRDPREIAELPQPALGLLAAAGPRSRRAPAEYASVVESVREGYLLHYARPRLLSGMDDDLALLAGDHLYAIGLDRLAGLRDLEAVHELADLISLAAQLHAEGDSAEAAAALWGAAVVAIAAGAGNGHEQAKAALRMGDPEAARALAQVAADTASRNGLGDRFERIADAIDFAPGGTP
jgi:hypothetical protein